MIGSIYALIAMGVAMIYGVMNVPDFALGAKAMLGGYVAFFMTAAFHQAYGVALIGSIVALAILGLAVERLIFRPLTKAPPDQWLHLRLRLGFGVRELCPDRLRLRLSPHPVAI